MADDTRVPAAPMCHQSSAVSWWAACARPAVTLVLVKRCNHASSLRPKQGRGPSLAARTPPSVTSAQRLYRLTRRPCGGGCACGRGARAQNQQQNRSQPNQHQRNLNAASARRGHGHGCRGRSGRPCRRSACDRRPGSRDATRANATRPRKKPKSHARSAHGHHASHRETPNATRHGRPGLVPRSGERSRPGPRGPRRPGPHACAWRAAGDRSCPPECPGR